MTFSLANILVILALIAFVLAALGWKFRKTEMISVGLALWSLSVLIGHSLSSINLGTLFLILAFIAFVAAAVGWSYRKINLIAVGLALWMLSIVIP
jgi:hypothetical protein